MDDQGDSLDMDASRRDVRRNKDVETASTELCQGALSLALATVAVDCGGPEPPEAEAARKAVRPSLRPAEDDGWPLGCDRLGGHGSTVALLDPPEVVLYLP